MSVHRARESLRAKGFEDRIREFTVSSATVELAALAVGVEPARIAKTLSFAVNGAVVLLVCAGDRKVDNGKFKAAFHTKAKMLPRDEAEARIGHAVGGVCPFGIEKDVSCYLDASLRRFDTVYPAAGSDASAVRLSPDELEAACDGFCGWIDVCSEL